MVVKLGIQEGHIREFQIDQNIHYMDSLCLGYEGMEVSITPSGHSIHFEHPIRGYFGDIKNGILRLYRYSDTKIETLTQRFVSSSNATLSGTLVLALRGNQTLKASFFDTKFENFLHSHRILSAMHASPNQKWTVDNDEKFITDGNKLVSELPAGKTLYQVSSASYVFIASQRLDPNGISVLRSALYSLRNPMDLDLDPTK